MSRDQNKDGRRAGDLRQTGEFGLNQHWGYDLCEVDKASAGSLVGQSKDGHRQFMALVKSDPRYQADRKYIFTTTILLHHHHSAGIRHRAALVYFFQLRPCLPGAATLLELRLTLFQSRPPYRSASSDH
jgi:hypothetical protein